MNCSRPAHRERDCKGKHIFYICKLFSLFFKIIFKKNLRAYKYIIGILFRRFQENFIFACVNRIE